MKRIGYNLNWLKEELKESECLKYVYFWGHTPSKDGSLTQTCLSQWWPCEFTHDGNLFKSTEHWMMYQKAMLFKDVTIAQEILVCEKPAEAKALGRKVSNFDHGVWLEHRMPIVIEGNRLKFSQNKDLKTYLLNTKDRILVEASPVDEIWGVGLAADSKKIEDPNQWRGLNLLGFALMEVRDLLK